KDVSNIKKIDLSVEALDALKTQVPSVFDNYIGSKVGDVFQKELKKHTTDLIQKYSLQGNKLRSNKIRSLLSTQLTRQLSKTLIEDENAIDKGVADIVKDHKRKHDDDEDDDDEDPLARPNQNKKTKRRRTKDFESSKKPSSTKETPKVEEPIADVIMDDAGDDGARDDNQPQETLETKARKTLNPDWFKQPPMPPTPDPE
ncbi:hypothetical protein Tco_1524409, partial [Tanacetum coccineum]